MATCSRLGRWPKANLEPVIEVMADVHINRPASVVFDYLADMSNNPRWQGGMKSCEWTSDPPVGVGSTYEQEAIFLGRKILSSFKVTEFVPGSVIHIVSAGGTMDIDVTRTVEVQADGTAFVTAVVKGKPPGLMRFAAPLMKVMVGSRVRKDYKNLKEILESAG